MKTQVLFLLLFVISVSSASGCASEPAPSGTTPERVAETQGPDPNAVEADSAPTSDDSGFVVAEDTFSENAIEMPNEPGIDDLNPDGDTMIPIEPEDDIRLSGPPGSGNAVNLGNVSGPSGSGNRSNRRRRGPRDCSLLDRPSEPQCLVVRLRSPTPANFATLSRRLAAEGIAVHGDESLAMLEITNPQIRRVFSGRVVHELGAASSFNGMVCIPYLRGARIPARYRSLILWINTDPQIC